jgi:hypothetical protein
MVMVESRAEQLRQKNREQSEERWRAVEQFLMNQYWAKWRTVWRDKSSDRAEWRSGIGQTGEQVEAAECSRLGEGKS